MWVLVVVLIDGAGMFSYAEGFPYRDIHKCQNDANDIYYSHMATRPNPEAYVVTYCAEVPKGV